MVNTELLSKAIMTLPLKKSGFAMPPRNIPQDGGTISAVQSLVYMGDMLESMRKIARAQGLDVLAHMLELARMEARLAARDEAQPDSPVKPR